MASGPIISWQRHGEKVETVKDFIFLGSEIIVDGVCNHEIKRCLLLGRKAWQPREQIKNQRHLPTKVCIVKAMVFSVVMYGCESWTIKKAECRRIEAFELWCWRRLLGNPLNWTEIKLVDPKGNQPWIFIEKTGAEAEAPILWLPDGKSRLIGKDPDTGNDWKQKEKGKA